MQSLAMRLPLRPVFLLTSAFLFIMGLRFVGAGIQEMQEMDWIGLHNVFIPTGLDIVFVNASWEAIGLQLAIGSVAALSALGLMARTKTVEAH
jgi:high-affinity iron transporter